MGPADALRAVEMIRPALTVPMHYNTMPPIVQDGDAFAAAARLPGSPPGCCGPERSWSCESGQSGYRAGRRTVPGGLLFRLDLTPGHLTAEAAGCMITIS